MKKIFSMLISALLLAGMTVGAAAFEKGVDYVVVSEMDPANNVAYGANYPGSPAAGAPECTSGELLKGEIIAALSRDGFHCFRGVSENYNATRAYDGDSMTCAYPFNTGVQSWMGMMLDQPYELTEVRIYPQPGWAVDIYEQAIQGSNDGENWTTIIYFEEYSEEAGYYIFTPETNAAYTDAGFADYSSCWVGGGSYSMYRYVNLSGGVVYGGAAEMEFYGVAKDAAEAEDTGFVPYVSVDAYYKDIEFTDAVSNSVDGSISGLIFGAGGDWMGHAYAHAFDGDSTTFYDPASTGPACFIGIYVDEPVVLGKVKILPVLDPDAPERIVRTETCQIQGSVDGVNWKTLIVVGKDDCVTTQEWITKEASDSEAYNYFRYVSDGNTHGEAAGILFFAADPADDSAADLPAASEPESAPQTFDAALIPAAMAGIAALGYAAAKKRK